VGAITAEDAPVVATPGSSILLLGVLRGAAAPRTPDRIQRSGRPPSGMLRPLLPSHWAHQIPGVNAIRDSGTASVISDHSPRSPGSLPMFFVPVTAPATIGKRTITAQVNRAAARYAWS
jgi:hypothetical protein